MSLGHYISLLFSWKVRYNKFTFGAYFRVKNSVKFAFHYELQKEVNDFSKRYCVFLPSFVFDWLLKCWLRGGRVCNTMLFLVLPTLNMPIPIRLEMIWDAVNEVWCLSIVWFHVVFSFESVSAVGSKSMWECYTQQGWESGFFSTFSLLLTQLCYFLCRARGNGSIHCRDPRLNRKYHGWCRASCWWWCEHIQSTHPGWSVCTGCRCHGNRTCQANIELWRGALNCRIYFGLKTFR